MNNIFDFKRFGLVFRKDFLENWKRYALLFLTMLGVIAIFNTWYSLLEYDKILQYQMFDQIKYLNKDLLISSSFMFAGFGLLFASTFMNPMNSKIKRITYLVSPSSNTEKYLSRWIIMTIVYIISFFVALWIADIIRVCICSARYPELEVKFIDLTKLIYPEYEGYNSEYLFSKPFFAISVNIYLLLQSFFILGSTFWEKSTFIKTFTAGVLIVISFILICRWAIILSYGNFEGFTNVLISLKHLNNREFDGDKALLFMSSIISLFTLANWTLAFLRFRESEIIKRI